MPSLNPKTITLATFHATAARYASLVPESLKALDEDRYVRIPALLAARTEAGDAYLRKEEVERLVEWKLKHGTFRPTLLALVRSNPSSAIEITTRTAFAALTHILPSYSPPALLKVLKVLTPLRGVGPATASLLLAVYAPAEVPFFSDELYRWIAWGADGGGAGWRRKIGYTGKEYGVVVEGVEGIRGRLAVEAGEMERGAWVLGKEGADVGDEEVKEVDDDEVEKGVQRGVKEKGKSRKRKVEVAEPVEGVRRSSRKKAKS